MATTVSKELARATGRRKEAVARVRLLPGDGTFHINGYRSLEDYFPNVAVRRVILEPLELLELGSAYAIHATIEGGGITGQAGALRHALSRALCELDPDYRPTLKKEGFLTRDARIKERRKYGLKKARKAPQYSKR